MRHYRQNEWNPNKRTEPIKEALPFVAMLLGLAAFIGLLIWLIETLN